MRRSGRSLTTCRAAAGAAAAAAAIVLGGGLRASPASARTGPPSSTPAPRHVVVVELFTSQGCSTCPPADRLLSRLGAAGADVLPLAFHVDYWNRIGWTDPFSSHDWSQRQVEYARALGLKNVYTPQAVVDGAAEMVGSEENQVRAAIASAASKPAAAISLELEPKGSKVRVTARIALPEPLRGGPENLMLAVYETGLVTPVKAGENNGQTLHNDYVVRSLRRAAEIAPGGSTSTSATATLSLEKGWNRSALGVAAFLQDPRSLAIRGAGAALLPGTSAAAR